MAIFILGNLACALAPSYAALMAARVLTSFAHGTFFGVGSVVATSLVGADKRASAIAVMFTGLTVATILGVPFGTWLGQWLGWRVTFWAVTLVGLLALTVVALLVPGDEAPQQRGTLRADLAVLARRSVVLGLLTTILGYAGVFAVFTYIAPILTRISGFTDAAVSPSLVVFGLGLLAGNLLGGKLADLRLVPTLLGSLVVLVAVCAAMTLAVCTKAGAIIFVGLLGAAAFASVPPLQIWVLEKAAGAGQSLASSLNIAAFNLGNALGAWVGGVTIDHGPGLGSVPLVAAMLTAMGLCLALWSVRLDRRDAAADPAFCTS
jgi:DHA1 family inner membrane transport protein